jgi:hypothetical protein
MGCWRGSGFSVAYFKYTFLAEPISIRKNQFARIAGLHGGRLFQHYVV